MANHFHESVRQLERRLDRIDEPAAIRLAHRESIDDDGDAVIALLVELGRRCELDRLTVHDRANEPLLARRLEEVAELALAPAYEWREHLDARPLGPREHRFGDLRGALSLHGAPALRAVRCAD